VTSRGIHAQNLEARGYSGFVTLDSLRSPRGSQRKSIPHLPGTYVVLRASDVQPQFVVEPRGGKSAAHCDHAAVGQLLVAWIPGASLVYVGEGGDLRDRIALLIRYGQGTTDGHCGGAWIWRLRDCWHLEIAYRMAATKAEAASDEAHLLGEFAERYGALPFANRRRGAILPRGRALT
jgi:hypothetical protein